MPTWPVSLPAVPQLAGLSVSPQSRLVSFGTETGPGKVRRRSTARVQNVSMSLLVTQAQLEDFLEFFRDDLEDGALVFTWTDPVEGGAASFRFSPSDPYSVAAAGRQLWSLGLNLLQVP